MQKMHREKDQARISSDRKAREVSRNMLGMSINPLNPVSHLEVIINIVNIGVGPDTVNVQDSLKVRREQMSEFKSTWSEHFHDPINKKTMTMMKVSVKVGVRHEPHLFESVP